MIQEVHKKFKIESQGSSRKEVAAWVNLDSVLDFQNLFQIFCKTLESLICINNYSNNFSWQTLAESRASDM